MAIRLDSAARYVCEQSDWRISNLSLQKILYLAQLEFMGEHDGARLTDTGFEAWDYGPVSPNLYHKIKIFGASPVEDVFFDALNLREESPRRRALQETCDMYLNLPPGELVEMTHWDFGAWALNYEPGVKNIPISDRDILSEFHNRERFKEAWEQIAPAY